MPALHWPSGLLNYRMFLCSPWLSQCFSSNSLKFGCGFKSFAARERVKTFQDPDVVQFQQSIKVITINTSSTRYASMHQSLASFPKVQAIPGPSVLTQATSSHSPLCGCCGWYFAKNRLKQAFSGSSWQQQRIDDNFWNIEPRSSLFSATHGLWHRDP